MRLGGYRTDAELADGLTQILRELKVISGEKTIPPQTINSMRNRVERSEYTIYVAKLCGVSPFWLAFGEGSPTDRTDTINERELQAQWRTYEPQLQQQIVALVRTARTAAAASNKTEDRQEGVSTKLSAQAETEGPLEHGASLRKQRRERRRGPKLRRG